VKAFLKATSFIVAFIMVFSLGYALRGSASVTAQGGSNFPLLTEAVTYVEANFVKDKPDPKFVEYELIRSYLAALGDGNTFFIEPAVAASESQALAGRYGGIGVEVQRNERGEFVLYPFPESSAKAEGIRDGDIIVSINAVPLDLNSSMDEVRQALRGELVEGVGVTLVVRNQADAPDAERMYFVPFAEVLVPSVIWRPVFEAPEFGYINIQRFTNRTPDEFSQAIAELRAANIQGVILDLRNNPGGLLQESVQVAEQFFDGGTLSIEKRVSGETIKEDTAGDLLTDLPVVVLVNNGTASASEIVAGAIQARDRGILVGQQTYGKGSIQVIFPLSDGSSIHVTTALWFTPDQSPLDGVGLTPDISMIPDENGRDVELGEAIRQLHAMLEQ
jgi:carboxyl-terminal processing protease